MTIMVLYNSSLEGRRLEEEERGKRKEEREVRKCFGEVSPTV